MDVIEAGLTLSLSAVAPGIAAAPRPVTRHKPAKKLASIFLCSWSSYDGAPNLAANEQTLRKVGSSQLSVTSPLKNAWVHGVRPMPAPSARLFHRLQRLGFERAVVSRPLSGFRARSVERLLTQTRIRNCRGLHHGVGQHMIAEQVAGSSATTWSGDRPEARKGVIRYRMKSYRSSAPAFFTTDIKSLVMSGTGSSTRYRASADELSQSSKSPHKDHSGSGSPYAGAVITTTS